MVTDRIAPFWKKCLKKWQRCQAAPAVAALDVATLEDRILFSVTPMVDGGVEGDMTAIDAALLVVGGDLEAACVQAGISCELGGGAVSSIEHENAPEGAATESATSEGDAELQTSDDEPEIDVPLISKVEVGVPTGDEGPSVQHELVVVDAGIENLEQLLKSLEASAGEQRELDIVFVERGEDGFAEISSALAGDTRYDAIHVISHGSEGMLRLGNTWLDATTIEQRLDEIQQWAGELADDADILLYGCDLAASDDGEWLVDRLHEITGLDVAASSDATGTLERGGDWDLEVNVGQIETAALFAPAGEEWEGLLAVYTVTNVNDSGAGSLRQAILDANANAGTDTIAFNIAGSGVHTIDVLSALPQITETIIIDGTTESGFAGAPLIEINGASAGAGAFGINIGAGAAGSTIRGLIVNRFANSGIAIYGGGSTIVGNYIGTDSTGTVDLGNAVDGVEVFSNNNTIGGLTAAARNIISGNNDDGVNIDTGATGNLVIGNYIGTDVTGTLDIGNSDDGVLIENAASGNIIGGTSAAARNIISGNNGDGVELTSSASGNVLNGNYIGLNAAGSGGIGNSGHGVHINGGTGSVVGGTAAGAGNTIAYNTGDGVYVASGTGHYILGNSIYLNGGLGIDLGTDGVNANDLNDADTGANELQNYVTITAANLISSTQVYAAGTFNSLANSYFRIEIFTSLVADASGHGEGRTYLGYVNAPTDAAGNVSGGLTLNASATLGTYLTVTVTRTDATYSTFYETSEFSQNAVITNTAPTLDSTKSPALTAVNEDAGAPVGAVGTLVSQLVDFAAPAGQVDNVTDPDSGALLGIAITAANTTNGTWWYSTNNGANWNALGAVSDASARLLAADANTRIYFQPNANYNGSTADAITFRAWDRTSGSNGGTADASTNGGSTAFSTATDTASLTVNAVNDPPVITSNGGGATASVSIAENTTAVTTVTSTDVDGPSATYSIVGGADSALFTIDSSTGALSFVSGRDFENPTDAGGNNIYDVTVQVSDGTLSDTQAIAVTITAVNDNTPVITSNGGGATASINVAENSTAVTTVTTTDLDLPGQTITYSIIGGADSALFTIDSSTGALSFVSLRNRESPTDAGGNNVYDVTVQASDGTFSDTQAIAVTITDVDEFDVGAVSDVNGAANAVNENAANGTVVGVTAFASDADATTNTIAYTLDDSAGGRFAIDGSTGVLTVANGALLDREAAASHNVTVRATSADGSFSTQSFTINLNDVDEFDTGSISDTNAAANAVNENAANGTVVGITVSASDADATTNTISYTLDDSAGGRFAIDGVTGVVTVANGTLLDREASASHNVTVRATSADGSFSTQTFTINVNDADEFDVGPVSDANAATNAVDENAANGAVVGVTALATDADTTGSTITYTLDDSAGGRFAIDGVTGVVTVADGTLLDREAAASHNITVRATSADSSFSTQSFTINLNDVDEFDVGVVSDANAAANAVSENAANGTVVGVTASASDADATTNTITYTLDDNSGGRFAIDGTTGVVTVADGTLLDREAAASHDITVRATSADGSFSTQVFTISLVAVNDNNPVITSNGGGATAAVNVAENSTAVTTVAATDADLPGQTLSYSIVGGADAALFTIDANTGALSFIAAPNYESPADAGGNNVYDVTVEVSDGAGSTDSQAIAVTVTPVNDNSPVITSDGGGAAASVSIAENTTAVTTVVATDADSPAQTFSYSIVGGADAALFTIDALTGALSFASGPDFESPADAGGNNVYDVTIQVSDGAGGTDTQAIAVSITPVNDNSPTITSDGGGATAGVNVAENSTAVTTVVATDLDLPGQTLTYSIVGGADSGRFAIDATTGALSFIAAPDYEGPADAGGNNIYDVVVEVSDGAGSTDTQAIAVTVTPVNDNSPVITSSGGGATASISLAENGTAVTAVTAIDADQPAQTFSYSIAGGADAGLFAIDGTTGALTFVAGPNFEAPSDAGGNNIYDVVVQVSDGAGGTDSQALAITITDVDEFDVGAVTDVNAAANSVSENAASGTAVGITAAASDADGTTSAITYTLDDDAGGRFAIDAVTGVVTVADGTLLDYETATSHNVIVRAASADGSFSTQSFTVNLVDVNDNAPIVTAGQAFSVVENSVNGTVVGNAVATDADTVGSLQNWTIVGGSGATAFAIDAASGQITVADVSQLDYEATTSFTLQLTVSDGVQTSVVETVTINLTNIPGVITLDLDANDSSGAAGAGYGGNFTEDGGTVAAADSDALVTSFEATIDTLTVTITNRLNGTAEVLSANTGGTNITATYSAATGVLTLSGSDSAANYEQVLRSITYNNASQNPDVTPRTITFVASGGGATSNVASATVAVTAVNDAPVSAGESFTLSNIDSLTVNAPGLLQNDADIEGNPLTTVLVAGPTSGTLVLNPNGTFTYTPNENFTGVDSFTYVVNDGTDNSGLVTVELTVTARGGPLPPDDPTDEPDDPGDGGGTPSIDDQIEDDDSDPIDGDTDDDSSPSVQPTGPDHRRVRDYGSDGSGQGEFGGNDFRPRSRAMDNDRAGGTIYRLLDGAKAARRAATSAQRAAFNQLYLAGNTIDVHEMGLALHQMRDDVEASSGPGRYLAGTVAIASATATAGYVVWALRSANLMTTFLATLPAWCHLDPLPLLADRPRFVPREEDESLLDIAARSPSARPSAAPQEAKA